MAKLERTEKPINVIIDELKRNEVGLPEIQRGYVWKPIQVRELVESLYKEYPCGLILEWKPPEEVIKNLELRNIVIEQGEVPSDKKPTLLVIDGQQRLTSFLKILYGDANVYFNIETEAFELYGPKLRGQPLWISVSEVLNEGAVKVWLTLKEKLNQPIEEEKYLNRLSKLEKIKDYKIPVEILHTDDYEEVTEAFIRINSKGTRLREAELALAQLALHLPGIVSKEFEKTLDEYEEKNFEFDPRFLIRCFAAVFTGQSRFRHLKKLWEAGQDELRKNWEVTREGLDYTINFLRNNTGIESSEWITSINALVPLVVYFAKKREPLTKEEENSLLFWFYSASMWGRYSSSAETKLDQDLTVLQPQENAVKKLIENCKKEIRNLKVDQESLIGNYQRSSFLPVLFAITRKKNAKDWFTGIELSSTNVGPSHQIELHHIFPRAVLKKQGYEPREMDDLANIAFLSQKANREIRHLEPIEYFRKFKIEHQRLESQFIPIQEELWKTENFKKFIQRRRESITDAMNEYLSHIGAEYMID